MSYERINVSLEADQIEALRTKIPSQQRSLIIRSALDAVLRFLELNPTYHMGSLLRGEIEVVRKP